MEELKIIHPMEFKPFGDGKHFDKCEEIKSITWSISNYDSERIDANIRWCYTTEGYSKSFEYSKKGYEEGCRWLEEKRLELIKQLL